jgi:hypothetical protein
MPPRRILSGLVLLASMAGISGCATTMPLQPGGRAPDLEKSTVFVARVKIRNDNRKEKQPELINLVIGVGNAPTQPFGKPTLIRNDKEGGKDYFASFEAPVGPKVTVESVGFMYHGFLVTAFAVAPIQVTLEVPQKKLVYLGRLDAVIVPREGNEDKPRAGAVLPLIDQAVAGFSNGSWDLKVTDDLDADMAALKEQYPFIANLPVEKAILQLVPVAAPADKPADKPSEVAKPAA